MGEFWVAVIITALIIGLIPAYIAQKKGRDFFPWYIYGVCLFFFAMIHAIVLPEKNEGKPDNQPLAQKVRESIIPLKETSVTNIYKDPLILNLNCPIDFLSYTIKVPEDHKNAFANIEFQNLSNKNVAGIKLKILCYDAFNEPVINDGDNFLEENIQDLSVSPGKKFGSETLIELEGFANTRKIKVIVTSVLFANGTIWNYNEDDLFELTTNPLQEEELAKLKIVAGKDVVCYARIEDAFWQCVCGRANLQDAINCIRCEREKQFVMKCCSFESQVDVELQHRREKMVEEERKRKEAQRKVQDEQRAKAKVLQKRIALSILLVFLVTMAWFSITNLILPSLAYKNAIALMDTENYDDAIVAFEDLGDYKDSKAKIDEIKNEILLPLTNYKEALLLMETGEYSAAIAAFQELGDYKDSKEKIDEIRYDILPAISEKDRYIISAGREHTVGLKTNGTVLAVGRNDYGQRNVGGWSDIVAVSAGSWHSVGLKTDGTVVAVGRNDFGQCDVGGWRDIIAVSAGAMHTVGLKMDGTVVAAGANHFGKCDVGGWNDVVGVSAGMEHTVGLKTDGTVVAVGRSNVEGWYGIGPAE